MGRTETHKFRNGGQQEPGKYVCANGRKTLRVVVHIFNITQVRCHTGTCIMAVDKMSVSLWITAYLYVVHVHTVLAATTSLLNYVKFLSLSSQFHWDLPNSRWCYSGTCLVAGVMTCLCVANVASARLHTCCHHFVLKWVFYAFLREIRSVSHVFVGGCHIIRATTL